LTVNMLIELLRLKKG